MAAMIVCCFQLLCLEVGTVWDVGCISAASIPWETCSGFRV